MANNSPTIVSASLSDDQLKKSIDSLVTHVDEAMKKMVQSTNNAVGEMEAKLRSLGSLKIDSGGTNDGGAGRRTQQHEKLTKAVNDASEAVSKETQKLQDLQQSLSGASDREQNFISQKERAANTIAQENELLSKQQSELAALKAQEQQLVDAHQRDMQSRQQNAAAIEKQRGAVKYYEEELSSLQARLTSAQAKIDRFYEVQAKARESISSRLHAPSDQFIGYNDYERGKSVYSKTEQDVRSLIKALSELDNADKKHGFGDELRRAYMNFTPSQDMANVFKRQQEEISSYIKTLQEAKKGTKGETRANLDNQILAGKELLAIYKELGNAQNALNKTVQKEGLRDGGNVGGIKRDIEETQKAYGIAKQKLDELTQSSQKSNQIRQESLNVAAKIQEKHKEISETRGRIAAAKKEQTEADKNASQAAKEKANIQSQVANQEKQVAEAKKQLTTATQQHTDAETKSSRATKEKTMTLDQQASAINTAIQSEKKYTDEIRNQAAAIRATKERQEKGWIIIGDNRFFDPERANVSKRDKQMLLSLEEQILQKENERIAAQEKQNRESQREVDIKSQLPKQGYLFTNEDVISNKVNNARAARYKQLQEEEKYVDSRNAAIAKALHIGQEEIKSYDIRTASAKELNAMLKQQRDAYSRLSTAQRSQKGGTELLRSIQDTQRALQKMQLQMSRPVNLKAALAGSEATLDDVAYKIRRLQAYMQGLDATNERSAAEIKKVAFNIELLKQKQNDLLNKNSQLIGSINSLIKSNTALGRSWNYMKNRMAFYFTVGASTQFVKNLIDIRSQYEMTERALGILVNSAERGTQIFNELSQMALVSPYTLIELSNAAKQLVAYDVAAKDVVDTTRRLADMASAVGVPMERLTYALGQIKAYGYLNSRDNRMFANAGIPLVKQLADYYTELEGKLVSTADVYDRIKKKAVGYADVMQVITKMTDEGGKFFDFQEKMSGTLKVQIANLTLAWNNMLNEIGASEQGILTTGIAALKNLFLAWKDLSNILTTIVAIFGIVKAQQILSNIAIGKSTVSLIGYINANKEATWVEYSRALQTKKLTATQAAWLLMTNKNNAALAASLVRLKIIDAATARYLTTMKGLSAGLLQLRIMSTMALNGLAKGVKALGAAFMTNLPLVALTAAIDLFTHFSSVASNNKSFSESIATGANEASEALRNFMNEEDKVQARAQAASGNLSNTEARKVWEAIREQIELSSQAANIFIPQLLSIPDINERITAAFDLADKIQEATNKLGELRDEMEVSQDSWLWGLFGEGIGEDLDDYNKRVKELREQAKYFAEGETSVWEDLKIAINGVWDGIGGGSGSQGAKEAVREIEKFANNAADVIKENLGKEGVLDEKQVTEAVARFVKAAEQQIPEIRGAGKKLFEALTNDIMGKQFEVFNAQEYYYSAFLEQLKKDYGSKFADITEDIKDKTVVWSDAQKKAIKETADKVKKDWPQASRDAIDEILKDLNNTEFKLHLIATFSTELTDFQQQFNTRANKLGTIVADTLQRFAPQSGDDLPSWTKKQQENIKALREENKNYERDSSEWAKQRIAANNTEIEGRTKALSLFKQSAISDKDSAKNKKQAESELQKALKDELSTIDKVRSIYKDLTKEGMSHADAVERATRGWNETVNAINKVLQKNGLQKLDLTKFAGIANPRELSDMLQSQLDILVKRGAKASEIKELQTTIQKLNVDAAKYDLTRITKGLNSELDKLKDEYELALELDADPELGNIFTDMFGIDTSSFPKSIDEYMRRAQQEFDKMRKERKFSEPLNIFKADDKAWENWGRKMGLVVDVFDENGDVIDKNTDALDKLKPKFIEAREVAKKWAKDVVKQTQDLQYKLADNNGKIAIEEEKLANLRQRLAQETNEEQKRLLELQIQDQENAINKLKEEILQLLPTYQRLFGEVAEHSAWMTRKLAKDYKNMLVEGKNRGLNPDNTYSVRDPITGQIARISKDRMGKELKNADKELQKTQSTVKKITEAFTKDEDGVVDWVHGVELIGEELGKLGQFVDVVGNIVDAFGNPNEYNATAEAIHDIATSMQGVATAAQGIGQIASGDYIGGAVSVASGLFSAISTWFDNGDKKILQQIKDSERSVKRLENAYKNLEVAIEEAYGTNVIGAKQAAIANKELQLAELQRQLALEKSRSSKNRDEDRIIELQGQIIDLRNDVKRSSQEIAKDLLGISSVGDAAMNLMNAYIDALRKGEDAQKAFSGSFNEMILNMLKQIWVTKVIGPQLESLVEEMNERIKKRSEKEAKDYESAVNEHARRKDLSDEDIRAELIRDKYQRWIREEWDGSLKTPNKVWKTLYDSITQEQIDAYRKETERKLKEAKRELDKATVPTVDDLDMVAQEGLRLLPNLEAMDDIFKSMLDRYGLMDTDADTSLSALQQGIAGVSEETASAVESYLNGISQQAYLRNDLLTQIRDAVIGLDMDIQSSTLSQMLLQLQQSYAVQMAIQGILEGVLTPNGRSFSVELAS